MDPTEAEPNISFFAHLQGSLQALLRPGYWVPGIRNLHSHKERWHVAANVETVFHDIMASYEQVQHQGDGMNTKYDIHSHNLYDSNTAFLRILAYTKWCEWLDVIEMKLSQVNVDQTLVEVLAFSSGFVPVRVPFAFIFNLGLFWMPFSDMKFNQKRVDVLKANMKTPVVASA